MELRGIRVSIAGEVHPLYDELVSRSSKDAEYRPFATMKDVFMLAACMGAKHGKHKPLTASRDVFSGETFNPKTDVPILAALAFHRTDDIETLLDPKRVVEIAQEWANGGIDLLQQEFDSRPGLKPLDKLVDMLLETH